MGTQPQEQERVLVDAALWREHTSREARLTDREEALLDALKQLEEQIAWCVRHGHKTLAGLYSAAQAHGLDLLGEVQRARKGGV